jgi:hypothetical protein
MSIDKVTGSHLLRTDTIVMRTMSIDLSTMSDDSSSKSCNNRTMFDYMRTDANNMRSMSIPSSTMLMSKVRSTSVLRTMSIDLSTMSDDSSYKSCNNRTMFDYMRTDANNMRTMSIHSSTMLMKKVRATSVLRTMSIDKADKSTFSAKIFSIEESKIYQRQERRIDNTWKADESNCKKDVGPGSVVDCGCFFSLFLILFQCAGRCLFPLESPARASST